MFWLQFEVITHSGRDNMDVAAKEAGHMISPAISEAGQCCVLTFLPLSFLYSLGSHSRGQCQPYFQWVLFTQLNIWKCLLTYPEVCCQWKLTYVFPFLTPQLLLIKGKKGREMGREADKEDTQISKEWECQCIRSVGALD